MKFNQKNNLYLANVDVSIRQTVSRKASVEAETSTLTK